MAAEGGPLAEEYFQGEFWATAEEVSLQPCFVLLASQFVTSILSCLLWQLTHTYLPLFEVLETMTNLPLSPYVLSLHFKVGGASRK